MARNILKIDDITIENVTQRTIAILGQKGAGKTLLINKIINQYPKIICIDCVGAVKAKAERFRVSESSLDKPVKFGRVSQLDKKVIINIGKLPQHKKAEFADNFFDTIYYPDGIIAIDEIHEICPQIRGKYSNSAERYIRHCRNENTGVVFTSQRPQAVNKMVLSLADCYILMRIIYHSDWEICEDIFRDHVSREELKQIHNKVGSFGLGDALVIDVRPSG